MAVYVDRARNSFGRMIMCHMVADTLEELHAMADAIGMKREWFQPTSFPHYDVSLSRRIRAIELGAVELDRRGLARFMREAKKRLFAEMYGMGDILVGRTITGRYPSGPEIQNVHGTPAHVLAKILGGSIGSKKERSGD